MTPDEKIRQGQDAEILLQNVTLLVAFANIENDSLAMWRKTSVNEAEKRENIWYIVKNCDAVKLELQTMVNEGKMAHAAVEAEKKAQEFEREHGHRPPM